MGENVNREICLTIQANRQDPQSNFTAHGYGWREEMITKINKAIVSDTPTSKLRSSEENLKISIPPDAFLKAYEKSYNHEKLTIGPLYAHPSINSRFDECKAVCVKKFMERYGISDVEDLIKHLIPDPCDLNNHYSNLSQDDIKDFQLLVTIDTVFIHEFLFFSSTARSYSRDKQHECLHGFFNNKTVQCHQEPIINTTYLNDFFNNDFKCKPVWRNLFLMGNQIPMSFLKRIAEFPNENEVNLKDLQAVLVDIVVRSCPFPMGYNDWHKNVGNPNLLNCEHLLDCQYVLVTQGLHEHKRSPQIQHNGSRNLIGAGRLQSRHRDRLPPASQLSKVGISFHAHKSGTSLIKYHRRTLQLHLPRIVVYEGTENVLRNLLAYEQTSKEGCEFAKYVVIMDSLIYTTEDLAILMKAGVIVNHLGSDQKLVKMWNKMCKNVVTIRSCKRLDDMTHNILKHYREPLRSMYVEFREKYFSRPWPTISLLSAFLLLLFTSVQTGYTVAGYYKPDI